MYTSYNKFGGICMSAIYRPMHLSDVDKVWDLFETLKLKQPDLKLIQIPDKKELRKWLNTENVFSYIAEDNEQVIAVLKGIRGKESGTRHAVYLSEATHPDYRNTDIDLALTSFALDDMKQDGVSLARVNVFSDNIVSLKTLLSLGFTISGTVFRHHYSEKIQQYVDDFILHKLL